MSCHASPSGENAAAGRARGGVATPVAVASSRCPWCGEQRADSASLAAHVAQCGRRQAQGGQAPLPSAKALGDEVRYRYMRILKQDPLNEASRTVSLVPLLLDKPFSCSVCGHTFASQAALRKHVRTHASCPHPPDSSQSFPLPSNALRYQGAHGLGVGGMVHAAGKAHAHTCEDCKHAFLTPAELRLHHMDLSSRSSCSGGDRPHQCNQCGKSFRTAGYLAVHTRVHTGERPFTCACGKAFVRRCNLRAHLVSHTRDRPHACTRPGCGQRFQFRKQLERHLHAECGQQKDADKDADDVIVLDTPPKEKAQVRGEVDVKRGGSAERPLAPPMAPQQGGLTVQGVSPQLSSNNAERAEPQQQVLGALPVRLLPGHLAERPNCIQSGSTQQAQQVPIIGTPGALPGGVSVFNVVAVRAVPGTIGSVKGNAKGSSDSLAANKAQAHMPIACVLNVKPSQQQGPPGLQGSLADVRVFTIPQPNPSLTQGLPKAKQRSASSQPGGRPILKAQRVLNVPVVCVGLHNGALVAGVPTGRRPNRTGPPPLRAILPAPAPPATSSPRQNASIRVMDPPPPPTRLHARPPKVPTESRNPADTLRAGPLETRIRQVYRSLDQDTPGRRVDVVDDPEFIDIETFAAIHAKYICDRNGV